MNKMKTWLAVVALMLCGGAWAAAPIAVWDKDFTQTEKVVGPYKLCLEMNGNTATGTAGSQSITIAADSEGPSGVMVRFKDAKTGNNITINDVSIIVHYTSWMNDIGSDKGAALISIWAPNQGTAAYRNLVGIAAKYDKTPAEIWGGRAYTVTNKNRYNNITFDESGYIGLGRSATNGQHAPNAMINTSSVVAQYFSCSGEGNRAGGFYIGGCDHGVATTDYNIGSNGAKLGELQTAAGLTIDKIMIFSGKLDANGLKDSTESTIYSTTVDGNTAWSSLSWRDLSGQSVALPDAPYANTRLSLTGTGSVTGAAQISGGLEVQNGVEISVTTLSAGATLSGTGIVKVQNVPTSCGEFWAGTLEIAAQDISSGSKQIPLHVYGGANATVILKGMNKGGYISGDSDTVNATVQIDGTTVFEQGTSGKTWTLRNLTGDGDLTLSDWSGANYGVGYTIQNLTNYGGTLTLKSMSGNNSNFTITLNNIVTTPVEGQPLVPVKLRKNSDKLKFNVSNTTLNGAAADLIVVTGEADSNGISTGGIYIAAAKIGEQKYGTLSDALAAAKVSATESAPVTVTLLADVANGYEIPANVIVDANGHTLAGAVTGSGKIAFTSFPSSSKFKASLLSADWKGTIKVSNLSINTNNNRFNDYGNEGSAVELENCTGYFHYTHRYIPEIVITGTMTQDSGYSGYYTAFRKLSGTGTILSASGKPSQNLYIEDASDFKGSIDIAAESIYFGADDNTHNRSATIIVPAEAKVTVADGKRWSATSGIVIKGEINGSGTLNGSVALNDGAVIDTTHGKLTVANGFTVTIAGAIGVKGAGIGDVFLKTSVAATGTADVRILDADGNVTGFGTVAYDSELGGLKIAEATSVYAVNEDTAITDIGADYTSLFVNGNHKLTGSGEFTIGSITCAANSTLTISSDITLKFSDNTVKIPDGVILEAGAKISGTAVPNFAGQTIKIDGSTMEADHSYDLVEWSGFMLNQHSYGNPTIEIVGGCSYTYDVIPLVHKVSIRVHSAEEAARKPLRIWCVGDSITEGYNGDSNGQTGGSCANYRVQLAGKLTLAGYNVQMVGFHQHRSFLPSGEWAPDKWAWHSGVSAQRVWTRTATGNQNGRAGYTEAIDAAMYQVGEADMVLIKLATNDIGNSDSADHILEGLQEIVKRVMNGMPKAKVALATTVWYKDINVATVSEKVREWVATKPYGDRLLLADLNEAMPNKTDKDGNLLFWLDNVHPNWNGHDKMSDVWAEVVKEAYPTASYEPDAPAEKTINYGAENNVDEAYRHGFTLNRKLAIPEKVSYALNDTPAYQVVNEVSSATKVGYYLELVRPATKFRPAELKYVWVDMDIPEGKSLDDMLVPTGTTLQGVVNKLHVVSNMGSVTTVPADNDTVKGFLEFSPYTAAGVAVSGTGYPTALWGCMDWNDTLPTTGDVGGLGCMQVHRIFSAGQENKLNNGGETIFAWNNWGEANAEGTAHAKARAGEIGIGNFAQHYLTSDETSNQSDVRRRGQGSQINAAIPGAGVGLGANFISSDYTTTRFSPFGDTMNAKAYSVRNLEIWTLDESTLPVASVTVGEETTEYYDISEAVSAAIADDVPMTLLKGVSPSSITVPADSTLKINKAEELALNADSAFGGTGKIVLNIDCKYGYSLSGDVKAYINADTAGRTTFVFTGADAKGATLDFGIAGADDNKINSHLVFKSGSHVVIVGKGTNSKDMTDTGSLENPVMLVKDGASLKYVIRDQNGWGTGTLKDKAVVKVEKGGTLDIYNNKGYNPSGNANNTAFFQGRLVLEPGTTTSLYVLESGHKFKLSGADCGSAYPEKAQFYVPAPAEGASDDDCVAVFKKGEIAGQTSYGITMGSASAITVEARATFRIDCPFDISQMLNKYGEGTLELVQTPTASGTIKLHAGSLKVPAELAANRVVAGDNTKHVIFDAMTNTYYLSLIADGEAVSLSNKSVGSTDRSDFNSGDTYKFIIPTMASRPSGTQVMVRYIDIGYDKTQDQASLVHYMQISGVRSKEVVYSANHYASGEHRLRYEFEGLVLTCGTEYAITMLNGSKTAHTAPRFLLRNCGNGNATANAIIHDSHYSQSGNKFCIYCEVTANAVVGKVAANYVAGTYTSYGTAAAVVTAAKAGIVGIAKDVTLELAIGDAAALVKNGNTVTITGAGEVYESNYAGVTMYDVFKRIIYQTSNTAYLCISPCSHNPAHSCIDDAAKFYLNANGTGDAVVWQVGDAIVMTDSNYWFGPGLAGKTFIIPSGKTFSLNQTSDTGASFKDAKVYVVGTVNQSDSTIKNSAFILRGGTLKLKNAYTGTISVTGRGTATMDGAAISLPFYGVKPETEGEEVVIEDVVETVEIQPNTNVTVPVNTEVSKIKVKYGDTDLTGGAQPKVTVSVNQTTGKVELDTTAAAKPNVTAMAATTEDAADKVTFTLTPIPGLFYSVETSEDPLFSAPTSGVSEQATTGDEKTLKANVNLTGQKKVQYFRVRVKATK